MKLTRHGIERVLAEYRVAAGRTRLTAAAVDDFLQSVSRTLLNYYTQFPEGTEFEYRIRKRFMRVELRIRISGEKKSPYDRSDQSMEQEIEKKIRSMRLASYWEMQYFYFRETNILYFITPPVVKRAAVLNPVIIAVLIGLGLGLLCSLLPEHISGFLSDDIAEPVLNIVIKVMSGIMGPIMFVSLVTSISTLDGINEFNRLGSKIFRRFLWIMILLTGMTMAIVMVVFAIRPVNADTAISPRTIIDLVLSVIPLNLVTPFVENNFPQIMVLGILMGVALLLLDRGESVLTGFLMDVRDWLNELLRLVLKLTPLIPGLTIFRLFVKRDFADLFRGWKYIAIIYGCILLALIIKILKVKIRCKNLSISFILRKIGPLAKLGFLSGSEIVALKKFYDVTEKDLNIAPSFVNLWIPLNQAMFSPIAPIYYVLGTCFVADMTGTPVSISFLFILFVITVQLSLAYPGHIPGITILFNALGLPADYIGLFSAYSVFVKNAVTAYGMAFRTLEITELAYTTDNIMTKE